MVKTSTYVEVHRVRASSVALLLPVNCLSLAWELGKALRLDDDIIVGYVAPPDSAAMNKLALQSPQEVVETCRKPREDRSDDKASSRLQHPRLQCRFDTIMENVKPYFGNVFSQS